MCVSVVCYWCCYYSARDFIPFSLQCFSHFVTYTVRIHDKHQKQQHQLTCKHFIIVLHFECVVHIKGLLLLFLFSFSVKEERREEDWLLYSRYMYAFWFFWLYHFTHHIRSLFKRCSEGGDECACVETWTNFTMDECGAPIITYARVYPKSSIPFTHTRTEREHH